eukprot:scaffold590_cov383-Prasinococcus_capsulatus_cf.AAC.2
MVLPVNFLGAAVHRASACLPPNPENPNTNTALVEVDPSVCQNDNCREIIEGVSGNDWVGYYANFVDYSVHPTLNGWMCETVPNIFSVCGSPSARYNEVLDESSEVCADSGRSQERGRLSVCE